MKKLFTFVFSSLLAISTYANSDLLNLSEINLDTNQIKVDLSQQNYPLSAKSHERNIHSVTVNLQQIDLQSLNRMYPAGHRYWGEAWSNRIPHDYVADGLTEEEAEKAEEAAANKFAEEFERDLKNDLLSAIDRNTEPAKTTCQMVRISSNWLVGDSSCLPAYVRTNPDINSKNKEDVAFKSFIYAESEFRWMYFIDDIKIEGVTVYPVGNMFIGKGLILIHLSDNQINNMKELGFSPIAKIGFTKSIKSIYLGGKKINGYKVEGHTLVYSKYRTHAGTPIFGEDDRYREFLLGFNNAPYENFTKGMSNKFSPTSGTAYQILTQEMREFIKNTVEANNK